MVTNAGGSYSRWKDLAVTRWREDSTRDNWGNFCYVRDLDDGEFWSTTYQPTLVEPRKYEVIFSEGRAEFRRSDRGIDLYTEIVVSPEDDIELRRTRITNKSDRAHDRSHQLCRSGDGAGRRRRCPPGLQQAVRADRNPARRKRHPVHAPPARRHEDAVAAALHDGA
jgi:hypothetical protein